MEALNEANPGGVFEEPRVDQMTKESDIIGEL